MKKLICKIVKYLIDILSEIYTWCHTTIAAPTLLTAVVVPPDIELEWIDNADNNTCFNVWRSTDGTNFILIDTIGDLENYTDTTATPGQNYWYKVQACDDDGNTSDFSNTVITLVTEIIYGILYNWWVVDGNIAPAGWHVPSKTEYENLMKFLDPAWTDFVNIAGGYMKESGTTYWNNPNTGADNSSGFNGRGSGVRSYTDGTFDSIQLQARYWIKEQFDANNGKVVTLDFNSARFSVATLGDYTGDKNYGQSIRLIKDDTVDPGSLTDYDGNIYPTVTIGTQVWMAQNLIVKHYNDGTPIPEIVDSPTWIGLSTGAWCYYNNDPIYM